MENISKSEYWKNWDVRRNGVGANLEFFANNHEHVERTLRYASEYTGLSISFDVSIAPCEGGGYLGTIYAPLWLVHHVGLGHKL